MQEDDMIGERLNLSGRGVVVAGAGGGGIGTAVCRLLAEAGCTVVAWDRDPDRLAITEQALDGLGGPHRSALVDVLDADAVADAVRGAGPLHGLVHVVGGLEPDQWAPLLDVTPEAFEEIVHRNLTSALVTSTAVASRLVDQARGGSIVYLASIAGLSAMPFGGAYAAAKAGMVTLMRTAALEWGPFGIRVNAVAPGTVRVPRNRSERGDEDTVEERAAIPLGRRGQPDDIAGAALFLLSDLAGFVTGQVLAVDGGSSARPSYLDAASLPVFVRDPALRARLGDIAEPAARRDTHS
jgi:NAD(P)-dependent dehydrogenase (short-subunit alcohol dehydrogenase family)